MSESTDWNVEDYRNEDESSEHWALRKAFMERWKDQFSEDRIVCLARVFANIEFLGCRYPREVMKAVEALSKEVAFEYRENKKKKLQRTFVSASDAASDRAKGSKRPHTDISNTPQTSNTQTSFRRFLPAGSEPDKQTSIGFPANETLDVSDDFNESKHSINFCTKFEELCRRNNLAPDNESLGRDFEEFCKNSSENSLAYNFDEFLKRSNIKNAISKIGNKLDQFGNFGSDFAAKEKRAKQHARKQHNSYIQNDFPLTRSKYGNLVLFERTGSYVSNILNSCQSSKVQLLFNEGRDPGGCYTCDVSVNSIQVSSAKSMESKKACKELAAKAAFEILQNDCYLILVKQSHRAIDEDKKISADKVEKGSGVDIGVGLATKVDSAIATRMMKMMGWSGGALGASTDGISEPIVPNLRQVHRQGLGSECSDARSMDRGTLQGLRKIIEDFARTPAADYELVFANDFSKDERQAMHKMALKCGIKSKSYGQDNDRYMVISKPISPPELVKTLIDSDYSNDRYRLFSPAGK